MPHPLDDFYSTRQCFSCQRIGLNLYVCDETRDDAGVPQKNWYCSQCMIGRTVRVFWPVDQQWYAGLVKQYNESTDEHFLLYSDGDTEWVKIGENANGGGPPTTSHNSHKPFPSNTNNTRGVGDNGTLSLAHPAQRNVGSYPSMDQESASHSQILADMKLGMIQSSQGPVNRDVGGYPSYVGGGDGVFSHPINHGMRIHNHPAPYPPFMPPPTTVTIPVPFAHHPSSFVRQQGQGHNTVQFNGQPPRYLHEQQFVTPPHPSMATQPYQNNMPVSNMEFHRSTSYTNGPYHSDPMISRLPSQPYPRGPPFTSTAHNSMTGPVPQGNPQNLSYSGQMKFPLGPMVSNNMGTFPSGAISYPQGPMISNNMSNNFPNRVFHPAPRPPTHYTQNPEPQMIAQPASLNGPPMCYPRGRGPGPGPIISDNMPTVPNRTIYHNQPQIAVGPNTGTDSNIQSLQQQQPLPQKGSKRLETGVDEGTDYLSTLKYGKRKAGTRPWTKQEDEVLLDMVDKFKGLPVKWPIVSEKLPARTGKQCRERYVNHLNPRLNNSQWHLCEDASIFLLFTRMGSKWSKLAKLIVGRTDNNIKNRFHNLRRQLESEDSHRRGLSNLSEYSEEIRLDRMETSPRYLQGHSDPLWEVPLGIIAAQSVLATVEDPTVPGFKFKQFGPFREASSEGEQCFRCGLYAPSVQCSKFICKSSRWCFACCSIPPHLSGNLLRVVLNLRRSMDQEERAIVEGWDLPRLPKNA